MRRHCAGRQRAHNLISASVPRTITPQAAGSGRRRFATSGAITIQRRARQQRAQQSLRNNRPGWQAICQQSGVRRHNNNTRPIRHQQRSLPAGLLPANQHLPQATADTLSAHRSPRPQYSTTRRCANIATARTSAQRAGLRHARHNLIAQARRRLRRRHYRSSGASDRLQQYNNQAHNNSTIAQQYYNTGFATISHNND